MCMKSVLCFPLTVTTSFKNQHPARHHTRHLTHLVAAALAPGQLGDGDGDEDHQEAGGQVLLVTLALGGRGLLQRGQQVRVNLGKDIILWMKTYAKGSSPKINQAFVFHLCFLGLKS